MTAAALATAAGWKRRSVGSAASCGRRWPSSRAATPTWSTRKIRSKTLWLLLSGHMLMRPFRAGTNVTLHKDAAWKEAWRDFRDSNKFVQGVFGMKDVYQESDNPLISTARSITDRVAGFFAENETAQVIKKIRSMDPGFQVEAFLRE